MMNLEEMNQLGLVVKPPKRYLGPSPEFFKEVPGFEEPDKNQCPYDKNHFVVNQTRLDKHVLKCRRKYREKLAKEGELIPMRTCRYNINHEVDAPEIYYHEARCYSRHKVWHYQLNVIEFFDEEFKFPEGTTWEDYLDEKELDEMYAGLHIDTLVGSDTFGEEIPIHEIGTPADLERVHRYKPSDHIKLPLNEEEPEQLEESEIEDTASTSSSSSSSSDSSDTLVHPDNLLENVDITSEDETTA